MKTDAVFTRPIPAEKITPADCSAHARTLAWGR